MSRLAQDLDQKTTWRSFQPRILIALLGLAMLAVTCTARFNSQSDALLDGDWIDPILNQIALLLPGRPFISAGLDGEFGTGDDVISTHLIGDLDLVLRAGISDSVGPLPPPALAAVEALFATAAADGMGTEIDFIVAAVDGMTPNPLDDPVFSPAIEGNPMLVLAFADLDADGYIGPTLLDGDAFDGEVESAELEPIGMQMLPVLSGRAIGRIRLLAGGPTANPTRIILTAVAFTGEPDPALFGGIVPIGPLMSTAQPILPPTFPADVIDAGPAGPEPMTPDRPLPIRIESAIDPDPTSPFWGEFFSLRLDGSEVSVDGATSLAGDIARIGAALSARLPSYKDLDRRVVRSGLDDAGLPHPFEIAEQIMIADDGMASDVEVRIVPLDRLGSITDLYEPEIVTVTTGGVVQILSPDTDGDPYHESIVLSSARGVTLRLGDSGGEFDDPLSDTLIIDSRIGGSIVDLILPDPDVDDSGVVDTADLSLVEASRGMEIGDLFYQWRLDVNGDGRVDKKDMRIVESYLGTVIPLP